jgi:hypothetical protein
MLTLLGYAAQLQRDEAETAMPAKMSSVNLKYIAKEAGRCRHFCPSKWAKVGGMLQMDGTTKFAPTESY